MSVALYFIFTLTAGLFVSAVGRVFLDRTRTPLSWVDQIIWASVPLLLLTVLIATAFGQNMKPRLTAELAKNFSAIFSPDRVSKK